MKFSETINCLDFHDHGVRYEQIEPVATINFNGSADNGVSDFIRLRGLLRASAVDLVIGDND